MSPANKEKGKMVKLKDFMVKSPVKSKFSEMSLSSFSFQRDSRFVEWFNCGLKIPIRFGL